MYCQECNERPATVHFTKIVNGNKSEFHLCEQCAREKGELVYKGSSGFSIHSLLSGLLNFDQGNVTNNAGHAAQTTQQRCSTCGLTYSQFSQAGRFGCADCYHSFQQRLDPLLRRVHGSTAHTGKIPVRAGGVIHVRKELSRLKREQQEKIDLEQFEEAAVLRDKIRELEQQLHSNAKDQGV
ncbi:UvrB/UvrC motif-containing protein [Fodinisporobacter ferrooxydans]|uniref:UvrB/UvrC motif-containing protein n=1 Tax=Fodinisporobacter ferrooxydans TaxID=2901836 RepID=A0ABY4CR12_9BACL|nr:UvrB/UvrC motif-containing protein [Alicyclobacillaceae bacterium MYW30-H2]